MGFEEAMELLVGGDGETTVKSKEEEAVEERIVTAR